jgi:hypothetical protein
MVAPNSYNKKKETTYYPPIHSFPLIGMLVCGIILIFIGIYLHVNNIELQGNRGEDTFRINGPATICFGIATLIYPIYVLIKQYQENKSFDNNIF